MDRGILRPMRILVTGGAGFIGSHIAERYVRAGHGVRVLDDLSNGSLENMPEGVEFIEGDIRDPRACLHACDEAEVVFHEAALGSVPRSVEDPRTTVDVNVMGTLAMLEAARAAGVRRFVYAASSSAYGGAQGPLSEDRVPDPRSPYAASKLAAEHLCASFARTYGMRTVALRYFNVFGPRQRPDGPYAAVVPRWASAMLDGRRPVVFGDGRQTRDFTFVDNVVLANVLAAEADLEDSAFGRVYNVGCGASCTLLELAEAIAGAVGVRSDPEFSTERPGDVRDSLACIDAAAADLGYVPMVGLREGIKRYVAWLREPR